MSEQSPASSSPGLPSSTAEVGDQASRPDSVPVPGPALQRCVDLARKSGRFFRAYLKSLVLLVTAIIAGFAAFVCFPKDAPVAPSGSLRIINIDAPFVPNNVYVTLVNDNSHNGITVLALVDSTTPQSAHANLDIQVPITTWGGANKCAPPPTRCVPLSTAKVVRLEFPALTKATLGAQTLYRESLSVFIPGVGYNAAWNNEYVSATLPSVQVYLFRAGTYTHEDVPAIIAVQIPNAHQYTWTSGTSPLDNGSYVSWSFTASPGSAQVNNGISLPAQDSATKLIFVAGALLGIAGGALVGAIQEAVKSE